MPVAGEDLREAAGEDPAAGCGRERQVHLPEADADHPRPGLRPARARGVPPHHLQQCDQRCGDAAGLGDPWGAGPGTALTRQPRVCGDWTGPNRSGERAGGRASGTVLCAAVPWSLRSRTSRCPPCYPSVGHGRPRTPPLASPPLRGKCGEQGDSGQQGDLCPPSTPD